MKVEPEGLLLLGGRSTRFGTDKMGAPLGGAPMYHAPFRALGSVCAHIHLSVAHPDASFAPPPDDAGCSWDAVPDTLPGQGPLGGIVAALGYADLLVVAGDLAAIHGHDLERILRAAEASDAALVLARAHGSGREQPLCGLWRRELLPDLQAYLDGGGRSVFGFLKRATIKWVDLDDAHLVNINRPEDLDLLTRMS